MIARDKINTVIGILEVYGHLRDKVDKIDGLVANAREQGSTRSRISIDNMVFYVDLAKGDLLMKEMVAAVRQEILDVKKELFDLGVEVE